MPDGDIAYISFDRVPSPKGASVHILAFARALAGAFGALDLVTLPPSPEDGTAERVAAALGPGIRHVPLPADGDTIVARALRFRAEIARWWGSRRIEVAHFRSIYEGYPIACRKGRVCDRIVFEVNGLPSIELKYHYAGVAEDRELLRKLLAQEQRCIEAADLIVTPSRVTSEHLLRRGADPAKVRVIPNGVDLSVFRPGPPKGADGREVRLLYWGTMSAWQGVLVALDALRLCRRDFPARLTLVGPATPRQKKVLDRECDDREIAGFVERLPPATQEELCRIIHGHDVALAPLLNDDRNRVQGCCPLKVLEAMAAGIPLVASDMPVVSDLAENGTHALLVKPGSAKAIKDAVLRLRAEPGLGERLAAAARRRVEERFTWETAGRSLARAYEEALGFCAQRS